MRHVSVKKTSFDNNNNYNNHRGDYFLTMSFEGLTLKMQNMHGVL
jgi:hypothetical protein